METKTTSTQKLNNISTTANSNTLKQQTSASKVDIDVTMDDDDAIIENDVIKKNKQIKTTSNKF